jgi:hypothetical protein
MAAHSHVARHVDTTHGHAEVTRVWVSVVKIRTGDQFRKVALDWGFRAAEDLGIDPGGADLSNLLDPPEDDLREK